MMDGPADNLHIPAPIADRLPAGMPIKDALDVAYGAMGHTHRTHLWSDAVYPDPLLGYHFRKCILPGCIDRQVVNDAANRPDHETGLMSDYMYDDPYGVESARRWHAANGLHYDPDTIPATEESW